MYTWLIIKNKILKQIIAFFYINVPSHNTWNMTRKRFFCSLWADSTFSCSLSICSSRAPSFLSLLLSSSSLRYRMQRNKKTMPFRIPVYWIPSSKGKDFIVWLNSIWRLVFCRESIPSPQTCIHLSKSGTCLR